MRDVEIGEAHALRRHAVEVRCGVALRAEAAYIRIAHVVAEDDDDVGQALDVGRCAPSSGAEQRRRYDGPKDGTGTVSEHAEERLGCHDDGFLRVAILPSVPAASTPNCPGRDLAVEAGFRYGWVIGVRPSETLL